MRNPGIWTAVLLVLAPATAFAYIDPGTGSALVQGVIAALAAVGVTLKLYWHKFVGLFGSKKDDVQENATPDEQH